jgi:hypothetical protein
MQRIRHPGAVPVDGLMNRNDELQLSWPAHFRAPQAFVCKFNGSSDNHRVENNRLPFCDAI